MKELLFYIVILLSNIIQGITGFAGTILAMPPSLMLVGYDTAKPVLNVLGLLSGIYVFAGNRKLVNWKKSETKAAVAAEGAGTSSALSGIQSAYAVVGNVCLLAAAGIVHGIFVSGGPLLIGYLTRRMKDKASFRATISTVWIVLNSMILVDDIRAGLWNAALMKTQLFAIPFLLIGMYLGGKLYKRMSQHFFMVLTYVLLLISGVTLLIK